MPGESKWSRTGAEPKTPSTPGDRPRPPAGQSAPDRCAGPHTRTGRHSPGHGPTRPPEDPAAVAKVPPVQHSCLLAAATPSGVAQQQGAPQKRKFAHPRRPRRAVRPHTTGPRKHRGQPPPGARRQIRSGTGGPKCLQRRPSACADTRAQKVPFSAGLLRGGPVFSAHSLASSSPVLL
ncbi:hypothetical protein NDU88_001170 [Pleurodeles waltl]|uniref:Uncharacterized protein n=1 Tax=Pleurodeles waltl TaxID=8319 RepID=A0AAV7ML10_PLEWA|nr:hypothetical protein NDU88_001170 [Pleurodeles waltl]